MFLQMLTKLYFFQRDEGKYLPRSVIQLVLLGLKCLMTDRLGLKETLVLEPVSLSALSVIPRWAKKETHTHTHRDNPQTAHMRFIIPQPGVLGKIKAG